ncbi:MAG: thioredoxin domain-containing protein [Desulfocapsa sp.]|nr:thioredoxin domain-containing protein [Desulfocapsa sp.]
MKQTNSKNIPSQTRAANHLLHEKSPYLLQHAYNPVDWYPWNAEALAKAALENKPIFLSIGYSTCHWCHVMAHESFEDQEVADFLNKHFISIKVDREELPGIDQIYMTATRAMTGGGGWPMSLFLFPNTKPFYAGTYFPPRASHGRPGFLEVLQTVHKAWKNDRESLRLSAEQVTAYIKKEIPGRSQTLDRAWMDKGFQQIEESYEPKYGGFGQAPKFPRPVVIDFLFHYYKASGKKEARDMALFTLEQMAAGGMYDHIGGGFHRYSVDTEWRVPHFEKMLYDQSQLASVYLSAFQLNGDPAFRETAVQILEYVLRDMQDPSGGFYSAEDADSENPYNPAEHGEGAYYLWTEGEIDTILPTREASLFKMYYGVKKDGNALYDPQKEFTGQNILYRAKDLAEVARSGGLKEVELTSQLQEARRKLLTKRQTRTAPHLDDKIITAWNGLMISALARGAMILEEGRYLSAASRGADFILHHLMAGGELKRRWRDGEAHFPAGLDDYSFFIQGLLDLYAASHDPLRLRQAMELTEKQIALFSDEKGGFYDTPESADLLVRMKGAYDGAEPSGNSVAAVNLLRLAGLTGKDEWRQLAEKSMESFGQALSSYPPAMPLMLVAMDFQQDKPRQIVVAGEPGDDDTQFLLREVYSRYLPNTIVILADGGENQKFLQTRLPFLATVEKREGRATAYVCEDFTCKMPVNTRIGLAALLDGRSVE